MTAIQCFAAYTLAAGLLTVTPGLDTALVTRTAIVEGRGRALAAAGGICTGCLVWGGLAALGLGAVLTLSPAAYAALRLAGAAYLCWLGLRMLGAGRAVTAAASPAARPGGAGRWYLRGLLTNLLNPKVGVFYVSFLPQFIPAGYGVLPTSLAFALIHASEGMLWMLALVTAAASLGRAMRSPRVARALDRVTGLVLIGFGLRLAFDRGR